jgi:hypothetical protein
MPAIGQPPRVAVTDFTVIESEVFGKDIHGI